MANEGTPHYEPPPIIAAPAAATAAPPAPVMQGIAKRVARRGD